MTIRAVQRVSLSVSDQDRAKRFYVDVLQFGLISDVPVPWGPSSSRWLEVAPHGADTTVVLGNWFPVAPGGGMGLMLESTDIVNDIESLRSRGVHVEGPVRTPWGLQAAFVDPDGNPLVLVEPVVARR